MAAPRSASDRSAVVHLPRSALKIVGIAFVTGALLFVLVWATGGENSFYKPTPAQPVTGAVPEGDMLQALPAPLPAQDQDGEIPQAKPPEELTPSERSPLPEELPTSVPTPSVITPSPALLDDAGATAPASPGTDSERPLPIQGQMPPPRYPAAALRRGEAGDVIVRVDVDTEGVPGGVTLVQRSGSHELDRAAMETIRRWRFRPAQRAGKPVAGSVDIPFEFKPAP